MFTIDVPTPIRSVASSSGRTELRRGDPPSQNEPKPSSSTKAAAEPAFSSPICLYVVQTASWSRSTSLSLRARDPLMSRARERRHAVAELGEVGIGARATLEPPVAALQGDRRLPEGEHLVPGQGAEVPAGLFRVHSDNLISAGEVRPAPSRG